MTWEGTPTTTVIADLLATALDGKRIELSDEVLAFPGDPTLISSARFYSGSTNEDLPALVTNVVQASLADPTKDQFVMVLQGASALSNPADPSTTVPSPPSVVMYTDLGDLSSQMAISAGGNSVGLAPTGVNVFAPSGVAINFTSLIKGIGVFVATGTTNTTGDITLSHGLPTTPIVLAGMGATGGTIYKPIAINRTSTQFTLRFINTSTQAAAPNATSVSYMALAVAI